MNCETRNWSVFGVRLRHWASPFRFSDSKNNVDRVIFRIHMVMPRAWICKFECNRFYAKIVYHAVLHLHINRVKRLLNESSRYLSRKQAQQTISSIYTVAYRYRLSNIELCYCVLVAYHYCTNPGFAILISRLRSFPISMRSRSQYNRRTLYINSLFNF